MKIVHNIGTIKDPNYNTREQIINCHEELGFDGIYLNVYENMDVLEGKKGIFFVMGNFLGGDNAFDLANVPKLEKYCTLDQIQQMCEKYDFEIGWHTYNHPDLTKFLNKRLIMEEVMPPSWLPNCKYFAYPYGRFNNLVVECVKEAGYEKAWSVTQGCKNPLSTDHKYKLFRNHIY